MRAFRPPRRAPAVAPGSAHTGLRGAGI